MVRHASLARNTASNFVVQGWSMLLAFATTPYIVHGFGTDAYGVFAALSVFLGYMSFLDLGFGWELIKFVADYDAHNDRQGIGEAAATTLAVFAVIGAGFTTAVFWFAPWLVRHGLNIPAELQSSGITALRVSGATFAVNLIGSVYGGVLRGLQRFELANGIQVVTGTVQTVTTISAIAGGYVLVGVCSASLGVSLASVITLYILVRRSGVFAMGARPKLAMLRVLGSFSAYATLSRLGAQTLYQVEKVFIGLWLPISALG